MRRWVPLAGALGVVTLLGALFFALQFVSDHDRTPPDERSLEPSGSKPPGGPGRVKSEIARLVFRGELGEREVEVLVAVAEPPAKVTIRTTRGQTLAELATAVADAVNARTDSTFRMNGITARAEGSTVTLTTRESWVYLCTTDAGLVVPAAPEQLAAARTGKVTHVQWRVPDGGYDRIHVLRGPEPVGEDLPGTTTEFVDREPVTASGTYVYRVFGVKENTPSCAARAEVFLRTIEVKPL